MKLPFDQVYCLCLSDNISRYNHAVEHFCKMHIIQQVHFWWTCKRSFSNTYAEITPQLRTPWYDKILKDNPHVYGNVWNCAIEHYDIIKTSLQRGFERILIFEDDISFVASYDYFWSLMNNIPNNYDVLLFRNNFRIFYPDSFMPEIEEYKGTYFKVENDFNTWRQAGTMMYALSKKAMEYILELNDIYGLTYSDGFLSKIDKTKFNVYEPFIRVCEPYGQSEIEI